MPNMYIDCDSCSLSPKSIKNLVILDWFGGWQGFFGINLLFILEVKTFFNAGCIFLRLFR